MNDHDLTALLERTTSSLDPDVERLLAGAAARGRRLGRRRRLVTGAGVLATVAVVAGAGLGIAQLGDTSAASGPGFATRPSDGASSRATVAVPSGSVVIVQPKSVRQIHRQLVRMLPGKVGPVLRGDYVVLSTPSLRQFSFTYDGGYLIFALQHEQAGALSRDHGSELRHGVPYQDVLMAADAHGVRYASAIALRDGYEVSLTVYNAAPPSRHTGSEKLRRLGARPVLDAAWRAEVVTSPAWFTTP